MVCGKLAAPETETLRDTGVAAGIVLPFPD